MNTRKVCISLILLALFLTGTCIFHTTPAQGTAYSYADAYINFNIYPTVDIELIGEYTDTYAATMNDAGDMLDDWGPFSASVNLSTQEGEGRGSANSSWNRVEESTFALAANGGHWYDTIAYAYHGLEFLVHGDGEISLSFDYGITQDLNAENTYDYAWAYSYVSFAFGAPTDSGHDGDELFNVVFGPDALSDGRGGQIGYRFPVMDGDTFWVDAYVENESYAETPEPSTCLLFLFGILGMVGIKKKIS